MELISVWQNANLCKQTDNNVFMFKLNDLTDSSKIKMRNDSKEIIVDQFTLQPVKTFQFRSRNGCKQVLRMREKAG